MRIMESRVKSIIREEVGRAIRSSLLLEADPDYPSVINAFKQMNPKPVGLIIDCSEMEGSGGGRYPLYQATKDGKIKKLSNDAGVAAFAFTDMLSENGELPEGCWIAGPSDGGDGPFEITNKA